MGAGPEPTIKRIVRIINDSVDITVAPDFRVVVIRDVPLFLQIHKCSGNGPKLSGNGNRGNGPALPRTVNNGNGNSLHDPMFKAPFEREPSRTRSRPSLGSILHQQMK